MNDYQEYIKNKKQLSGGFSRVFQNIQPLHVILLFAMVFLANSFIKNNKGNNSMMLLVAAAFAIFIFSIMKGNKEQKEIPRYIAQRIAQDDLQKEIEADGSYANGTKIRPTSYFKDQVWDSGDGTPKLFKYHFGFILQRPEHGPDYIIYEMNPFTGKCKGVKKTDIQFEGQEINDVKIIPITEIVSSKKFTSDNSEKQ